MASSEAAERFEEPPKTMTHSMRVRLSEKNGPHKTVFGVLSNKKYQVRTEKYNTHAGVQFALKNRRLMLT